MQNDLNLKKKFAQNGQDTTVKIIRQSFENTDLDCWAVCRTDVEEIP